MPLVPYLTQYGETGVFPQSICVGSSLLLSDQDTLSSTRGISTGLIFSLWLCYAAIYLVELVCPLRSLTSWLCCLAIPCRTPLTVFVFLLVLLTSISYSEAALDDGVLKIGHMQSLRPTIGSVVSNQQAFPRQCADRSFESSELMMLPGPSRSSPRADRTSSVELVDSLFGTIMSWHNGSVASSDLLSRIHAISGSSRLALHPPVYTGSVFFLFLFLFLCLTYPLFCQRIISVSPSRFSLCGIRFIVF